ncbi:MAG TPA: histidine triad nucleotide-binding protein, partial [Nitrospira sp.]
MSDCLFCRIVEKKIPAKVVYEDDQILAFDDVNPRAPVHTLVIPKQHVASVQDLGESDRTLLAQLLLACTKVAKHKGLADPGFRLVVNTGRDGG